MPRLSVVIPTLGQRPTLWRVLKRLGKQTIPSDKFEVIVGIDAHASEPDGLRRELKACPVQVETPPVRIPGASGARNAAWRHARSPIVLFIDDDILPAITMLAEHLDWHERHPEIEVGVLGHVRWAPELKVTPLMRWLEHGIQFDYPSIQGIDAGWGRFYTANVSVKKALIDRVGGFEEVRLPFGYEDLDLSLRMSKLGFRLLYNRNAVADHVHRMDIEFWKRRVKRIADSERRFVAIHPEVEPHFYPLFKRAMQMPPVSGRGRRLIRLLPPSFPWLGPRAWRSADIYYRQLLAPHFLNAWDAADSAESNQPRPVDPASLRNT